jgi:hypothetical protein
VASRPVTSRYHRRGQRETTGRDGDWHGGESQVVQTGRTVVVDWPEVQASGIYRNPVTGTTFDAAVGTVVGYANDLAFSRCGPAVSHDGGRTFRRTSLPAVTGQSTLCSNATTAVGPLDGRGGHLRPAVHRGRPE